jgi:hypothetical protein
MVHPGVIINTVQDLINYGRVKIKKIAVTGLTSSAETLSGFHLPAHAIVIDTWIHVKTHVDATTIDWGTEEAVGATGGDADGFAKAASSGADGIIRPGVTVDTDHYHANTRGALIGTYAAGTDTADRGLYIEFPDCVSGGREVSYTPANSTTALSADIYIAFIDLDSWPN